MITIMVPTKDRSAFVVRLLDYLASTGFDGRVAVADASGPAHLEAAERAVRRLAGRLDARHVAMPTGIAAGIEALCADLDTPYATLCGDDDLMVPAGLRRCADMLERSPDLAAVHGQGVLLLLDRDGPYGRCASAGPYPQTLRSEPTAADRVSAYLADYSVALFSVWRSEVWKEMWRGTGEVADTAFGAEILPCAVGVASGKVAAVDGLHLVRHVHEGRYVLHDFYDWLTSDDWHPSYEAFSRRVASAVMRIDGASAEQAAAAVKSGFWGYLALGTGAQYAASRGERRKASLLSRAARRLPGGLSVTGMSAPGSKYRADFMAVRAAIEGVPAAEGSDLT